jgi:hypothetical protein
MKMERAFRLTGEVALVSAIVLGIVGLLFRSFVWASWSPHGGDPYGPSDILELLIFYLVILLSAVCVLAAVGLLFSRQRTSRMLAAGIIVPAAYLLLHPLVPTFKFW